MGRTNDLPESLGEMFVYGEILCVDLWQRHMDITPDRRNRDNWMRPDKSYKTNTFPCKMGLSNGRDIP